MSTPGSDTITNALSLRLLALILPLLLSVSALKASEPEATEARAVTAMVAEDSTAVSGGETAGEAVPPEDEMEIVSIPEPSTLFLFGASAAFLALFLRGRSAANKAKEVNLVK